MYNLTVKKKSYFSIFLDFFETVFICVGIYLGVNVFLGQLVDISGSSMYPSLKDGEHVVTEKISLKFSPVDRGNIVVFSSPAEPGKLLIKRVVGLPGESVTVRGGNVYVNNVKLAETYLPTQTPTKAGSFLKEGIAYKLGATEYFMMGDNRSESFDSREFGPVNKDNIVGKAMLVYYPFSDFKLVN